MSATVCVASSVSVLTVVASGIGSVVLGAAIRRAPEWVVGTRVGDWLREHYGTLAVLIYVTMGLMVWAIGVFVGTVAQIITCPATASDMMMIVITCVGLTVGWRLAGYRSCRVTDADVERMEYISGLTAVTVLTATVGEVAPVIEQVVPVLYDELGDDGSGWYPDPSEMAYSARWWDGKVWTDRVRGIDPRTGEVVERIDLCSIPLDEQYVNDVIAEMQRLHDLEVES
jgi:hypothetical protein